MKIPFIKIYGQISNVWREFAYRSQIDPVGHYLPYGSNDAFPNELNELVEGSPTATSCLSTLTDFITGEGFNDPEMERMVINNQGMRFFELHQFTADSLAHNEGFAWLLKYNYVGQITEIYGLPFENCRLGKPDDRGYIGKIHYNPYFGIKALFKNQDTVVYDAYDPENVLQHIARDGKFFKGQILWYGIINRKSKFYPVPEYYSGKYWMRTEKNAGIYFDENLESGFLQTTALCMIGDPNDPAGVVEEDSKEKPKTKGEILDEVISREFSGVKKVGKIWVTWGSNKEEWPEFRAMPTNANSETYKSQYELATKNITVATKVPAILANISEGVSLGGDGNTIRAAVKLMQQRVKRKQSILTDTYGKVLGNWKTAVSTTDLYIVPYDPYPEMQSIDPQIWNEMSREERRKWIKDHTEIVLFDEQPLPGRPEPDPLPEPTPQAKFEAVMYNTYPEGARKSVKTALEWQEKTGNKCLRGGWGLEVSKKILEGKPLTFKEIRRLAKFLSKNILEGDKPFNEACTAVQFAAWGGSSMMQWANEKVKEWES